MYLSYYDKAHYWALFEQNPLTGQLISIDEKLLKYNYSPRMPPSGLCISPLGDGIYITDAARRTVIKRDITTGELETIQIFIEDIWWYRSP